MVVGPIIPCSEVLVIYRNFCTTSTLCSHGVLLSNSKTYTHS